jgi:hypothetical protein
MDYRPKKCGILISHLFSVIGISDAAVVKEGITYWTHDGSLPVELGRVEMSAWILALFIRI